MGREASDRIIRGIMSKFTAVRWSSLASAAYNNERERESLLAYKMTCR